jgi:hypothetical protein
VGRNSAIKRFDPQDTGETLDLLESHTGRLPVVLELLRSPWLMRASELLDDVPDGLGSSREETIAVSWDPQRSSPSAFVWNTREYRIDAVVQMWAIERSWWKPRDRVSRRCWRVIARGGTYDLAFDRLQKRWLLLGVQD